MANHTPGPWSLWTSCSWRRFGNDRGELVCEPTTQSDGHPDLYFRNGGQDGPDASLIAAAPDLLTAAIEAKSAMDSIWETKGQDDDWIYDEMGSELAAGYFSLRAAIATATGEQ